MPDTDLPAGDLDVAERMAGLPDDVLGFGESEAAPVDDEVNEPTEPSDVTNEAASEEDDEENVGEAQAEDPEFEIVDPANPEAKQSLKLSELVQTHREFAAFKGQQEQILQQYETQAQTHARERMGQMEQASRQVAYQLQAALQLVQPPARPNPMDPKYEFDERQYRIDEYQYQQGMGQYQQAQTLAKQFGQQAEQTRAAQTEQQELAELAKLNRVYPEFTKQETLNVILTETHKHYGISPQELDAILTDYRQALVLRDALEYRKMKAAGGDVKAKVVAKAAAKPAPAASQSKRTLSREQAQHMEARKALKQSGGKDINAAARGFMKYV